MKSAATNFVTIRKYLVLAGVTVFAPAGDSMLSYGMKQVGRVSPGHLQGVIAAVLNPWVAVGILLLLAFVIFNMTALSWADLTYVLPATSFGYVLVALIARFALHEHITPLRWAGIALIAGGVGFVAGGPALTAPADHDQSTEPAECLGTEKETEKGTKKDTEKDAEKETGTAAAAAASCGVKS
jgi:drug/metabolite transporter (DMT)-like permease